MKPRELLMAWITGVLAVFGLTVVFCKPQFDEFRDLRARRADAELQLRKEGNIRNDKQLIDRRLRDLQKKVGLLPKDEMPNVFLPRTINNLASEGTRVPLKDTRIGDEWALGKLKILPIKYAWGPTNTRGIRDLLLSLQESEIIFDVVELTVRSSGQDQLNGSLTVNCVYTINAEER